MFGNKKKQNNEYNKQKATNDSSNVNNKNEKKKVKKEKKSFFLFFISNWYLIWVLLAVNVVFSYMVLKDNDILIKKYEENIKKMDEISKRVIFLGYDGRVAKAQVSPIKSDIPGFKKMVANIIEYYLILDWEGMTKNFTYDVNNIDELFKTNEKVKEFFKNFVKNSGKFRKGFQEAKIFYELLINLKNSNKLPEIIKAKDYKINSYEVDGNSFYLDIVYNVSIKYYDLETDRYYDKEGNIRFKVYGIFNPAYGTAINPLGVIFTSIKATYVVK